MRPIERREKQTTGKQHNVLRCPTNEQQNQTAKQKRTRTRTRKRKKKENKWVVDEEKERAGTKAKRTQEITGSPRTVGITTSPKQSAQQVFAAQH